MRNGRKVSPNLSSIVERRDVPSPLSNSDPSQDTRVPSANLKMPLVLLLPPEVRFYWLNCSALTADQARSSLSQHNNVERGEKVPPTEEIKMLSADVKIDDLPVRAGLKVRRCNDPWQGFNDEMHESHRDFIAWFLKREHEVMLSIPSEDKNTDSFFIYPDDYEESAFNTCDFHRHKGNFSFDKYGYRLKKIMERVNDLAMMHSCISDEESRNNVKQRCRSFMENEFLIDALEAQKKKDNRKANRLFKYIEQCKQVWQEWNPA